MENRMTIHIDSFDGPFDLLYYLIQKNKLDIYEISVTEITEQYLDHLFAAAQLDMEVASEFLVMASTLLHIKSRVLLPRHEEGEEDNDVIDSREELIMRLLEYKKYRDVTQKFRQMQEGVSGYVYKYPESIHFKKYVQVGTHNVFELWSLLENLTESINVNMINTREKMKNIRTREKVSVAEKMKEIMKYLLDKTKVIFSDLFVKGKNSKLEIAAGFVGMLELSRLNRIKISQRGLFDRIYITRKDKKTDGSKH